MPGEVAGLRRGRTEVSRHGLTIPYFQMPVELLQKLVGNLMRCNTILLWPASMRMDCDLPPQNKTKLLIDGQNEMIAAWEHPVE